MQTGNVATTEMANFKLGINVCNGRQKYVLVKKLCNTVATKSSNKTSQHTPQYSLYLVPVLVVCVSEHLRLHYPFVYLDGGV